MKILRTLLVVAGALAVASAHPMGNFSVSHYARFDVRPGGIDLTYVLDLAEIPTFELLETWGIEAANRKATESRAIDHGRDWLSGLSVTADGRPIRPRFQSANAQVSDGAGGMPVLRVTVKAFSPVHASRMAYEDRNYPSRAGWKEVVVVPHSGATLISSNASSRDRSKALQQYPADATSAPPQDISASFAWSEPVQAAKAAPVPVTPLAAPVPAAPAFSEQQQRKSMGTVLRGDFLSRMLGGREITLTMILIGLCVAFGLGAAHALSPGHGKTIVAAYLVGSRGTMKHALFLGGMVTFTHTISVFGLGISMLLFQRYVAPERVIPALGVISGLSIVVIGSMLLYQRTKRLSADHHHDHDHHHHDHHHGHDHDHHHHDHDHAHHHTHSHGGHSHSHVPEEKITLASLIALGASGGLVPCPSALVLLLSAIALGRTGLGLLLLLAFSAGLALVLMAIGAMVLYAKTLLPERSAIAGPVFRYVPVFSAVVVMVLGLVMTGVSAGWIRTPV